MRNEHERRAGPVQFGENDRLPDIRRDNVFKAVFTRDSPASRGALSHLISALIGRTVSVTAITSNEPPSGDMRDRCIRFDIACKAASGELVNIEMSLNPSANEPARFEYYAARLFTGQDIQGSGKSYDNLKAAFQITILDKKQFFPDQDLVHTFQYYDRKHDIALDGKPRIITMELSKAKRTVEKPAEEMAAEEAWAVFFRYLTDLEKRGKINSILKKEEGIAMAGETLITITDAEREYARQTTLLKNKLDHQSDMTYARQEGLEQGLRKGEKKKAREIAGKLKTVGVAPDIISQSTGLTLREIAKIQPV